MSHSIEHRALRLLSNWIFWLLILRESKIWNKKGKSHALLWAAVPSRNLYHSNSYHDSCICEYLLNWHFWLFSFSLTKNWFIVVWQKENNFSISRKRNNVTLKVSQLICEKMTIYSLIGSDGGKKAPILWRMHYSYMWNYTQWKCTMQH